MFGETEPETEPETLELPNSAGQEPSLSNKHTEDFHRCLYLRAKKAPGFILNKYSR